MDEPLKLRNPKHYPDKPGYWLRNKQDGFGNSLFFMTSFCTLKDGTPLFSVYDFGSREDAVRQTTLVIIIEVLGGSKPSWFYMPGFFPEELEF